jgi:hypothetical protein
VASLPYRPGDIIRYVDMNMAEGGSFQRGMNYRPGGRTSIFLMSTRRGAPYNDEVRKRGCVLIYEGHNAPRQRGGPAPDTIDQPAVTPHGRPTQNGRFAAAALAFKQKRLPAEPIRVYDKIREGIWVYNGVFNLVDAWQKKSGPRKVYKFKLVLAEDEAVDSTPAMSQIEHTRVIPTPVKQEVWVRDGGRCVVCGSNENLHFDHIIPWSKGGSSLTADNIQLLCAKHNLAKHDRIE